MKDVRARNQDIERRLTDLENSGGSGGGGTIDDSNYAKLDKDNTFNGSQHFESDSFYNGGIDQEESFVNKKYVDDGLARKVEYYDTDWDNPDLDPNGRPDTIFGEKRPDLHYADTVTHDDRLAIQNPQQGSEFICINPWLAWDNGHNWGARIWRFHFDKWICVEGDIATETAATDHLVGPWGRPLGGVRRSGSQVSFNLHVKMTAAPSGVQGPVKIPEGFWPTLWDDNYVALSTATLDGSPAPTALFNNGLIQFVGPGWDQGGDCIVSGSWYTDRQWPTTYPIMTQGW